MELPIYIDGVQEGTVTLERTGHWAAVCACLRDVGRVVRLSLYGDGTFYLGIPEPEAGQLVLRRRISGEALNDFPDEPTYAGEAPRPQTNITASARHVLWHGGRAHYF